MEPAPGAAHSAPKATPSSARIHASVACRPNRSSLELQQCTGRRRRRCGSGRKHRRKRRRRGRITGSGRIGWGHARRGVAGRGDGAEHGRHTSAGDRHPDAELRSQHARRGSDTWIGHVTIHDAAQSQHTAKCTVATSWRHHDRPGEWPGRNERWNERRNERWNERPIAGNIGHGRCRGRRLGAVGLCRVHGAVE
jgi:hypothetical protein